MVKRQKAQASPSTEAVSLILPSLYLGPCSAASNKSFLENNAITHVLSIGSTPASKVEGVTYHRLSLTDSATSNLSKATGEACKIIDGAVSSKGKGGGKGKIYVHCSAGISRSPSLVVAYLMKSRGMSLKEALGQVARARPQVSPNPGFLRQLKELDQYLHGTVSLDVDELPKREKDRLALFVDHPQPVHTDDTPGTVG
ncbi:phosphatases II [Fomitopsis schrenkii]|uniref:protein-tyrosine-phosphatase n=1 Tax=Fomitopsis schrenkii TaxID=2126942 RepID=S8DKT8_FOMSC|nr:phosphatases II [Fomitopsis schrenkii]